MKLYNFFRSGTSHRLRIALNLKGLGYEHVTVDLRKNEHLGAAFKALNPQGLVPALEDGDRVLTQSVAIIEWLEERYPTPALLPADVNDRAHVRALAAVVGCDIHPVNNKRILDTLRVRFGADDAAINQWCGTWISDGFDAYEALLAKDTRRNAFSPTRRLVIGLASASSWRTGHAIPLLFHPGRPDCAGASALF
jgi:maleylpyruvate isomerase